MCFTVQTMATILSRLDGSPYEKLACPACDPQRSPLIMH
jgi:hypothetical protein